MSDPFARMSDRLLARLGGEAVLRGAIPCNASITHGVAVTGEYGEVVSYRATAMLPKSVNPRAGDSLYQNGTAWVLDSLESDDGYTSVFWLRHGGMP